MARLLLLSLLGVVLLSIGQSKVLSGSGSLNVISDSANQKAFSDSNWLQVDSWDDNSDVGNDINDEADSNDPIVDESDLEDELDEELDNYLDKIDDLNDKDESIDLSLDDLDDDQLTLYMNLEDQIFLAEVDFCFDRNLREKDNQFDEHIGLKLLEETRSLRTNGLHARRKRIAPLVGRAAFAVGRALFRRFARSGVTRSGSRVTRHYNGRGSYGDAVRDFNRMRPSNVKSFNNGRISGQTGTMGNHRVTVRNGSSGPNSRPTLEVRSGGSGVVRKFRYNRN